MKTLHIMFFFLAIYFMLTSIYLELFTGASWGEVNNNALWTIISLIGVLATEEGKDETTQTNNNREQCQ